MEVFLKLLGTGGIISVIGLVVFLFILKYSQGIFEWIEQKTFGTKNYVLEQLEVLFIDIKPVHVTYLILFLSIGQGMIVFLLLSLLSFWITGMFLGVIVAILGWKIPRIIIAFLLERRKKAYQGQMVDALTLLGNGIRAGLAVNQAIGMVVTEMEPPISQEFNVVLQHNRIGVPLEECLENLAKRIPLEDNDMFVSGINILKETGGNLAETFDTIVSIIRERIRLQQKIDTFVAQGMMQAIVICSMPFVIGTIYGISDPDSMVPMFTTPLGIIFLTVALFLVILGAYVIFKIINIKI